VRTFLEKLGPLARYIHMYGYQAISTGGWDPVLPGKNNFWSAVNGNTLEVRFPNCKEYEKKQGMGMFQDEEEGVCFDDKDKKYVNLKCLKVTKKVTRLNPNGRGTMNVNQTRFEWLKRSPELFYEGKPDKKRRVVIFGINEAEDPSSKHDIVIELDENQEIPSEEIRYANIMVKRSVLLSRFQDLDEVEYERRYEELASLKNDEILEKGHDVEVAIKQDEVINIPGISAVFEKIESVGRQYSTMKKIVMSREEGEVYIKRRNHDARYKFSDFKE
jgi:hypothetical protein